MSDTRRADALAFLRARNICVCCHQYHHACVAIPDDVGRHEDYYRIMNVTGRRPWETAEELMRIIERAEYRERLRALTR